MFNLYIFNISASDPICSSNLTDPDDSASEKDTVLIRCDLKYSGVWIPTMHWFKLIHDRSHPLESALTDPSNVQSASSFVIMQVNSSDNGAVIFCKTYFISSDQITTNASNIPDYVHHWNTTLNVECEFFRICAHLNNKLQQWCSSSSVILTTLFCTESRIPYLINCHV